MEYSFTAGVPKFPVVFMSLFFQFKPTLLCIQHETYALKKSEMSVKNCTALTFCLQSLLLFFPVVYILGCIFKNSGAKIKFFGILYSARHLTCRFFPFDVKSQKNFTCFFSVGCIATQLSIPMEINIFVDNQNVFEIESHNFF